MHSMDQRETIYDRFADGCQRRRDKISALLATTATEPPRGRVEAIRMLFHDWIGEAKILGFDRLAVTAAKAAEVLVLSAPFQPAPLIDSLRGKGHDV